jgi:hypothetical protein
MTTQTTMATLEVSPSARRKPLLRLAQTDPLIAPVKGDKSVISRVRPQASSAPPENRRNPHKSRLRTLEAAPSVITSEVLYQLSYVGGATVAALQPRRPVGRALSGPAAAAPTVRET